MQCSCLKNARDGGAWWTAVSGVAQSWTRLKQLSSGSSIKKNEMTPPAATWVDLKMIFSGVRERQTSHDVAYMWNPKKNGTNELIYKTEIESQM